MRLINVDDLIGNEIIGKDILSEQGGILLKAQTKFRTVFKDKLVSMGIKQIFIEDDFSEGIIPPEAIEQSLKLKLIHNLKEQFESMQDIMSINLSDIQSIATTILETMSSNEIVLDLMDLQRNDSYTYSHCLNVSIMSCAIAKKMGFSIDMIEQIILGALLHDIGKMILPKDILNKPDRLSDSERSIIETHSKLGYDLIKDNSGVNAITKVIVLCHHEREDGSGYPLGKGDDLHISAKIIAVADVFDALISDRPYRSGFPINMALNILNQENLNQNIICTLQSIVAFYPVGSTVQLSNGLVGLVEKNHSQDLKRPLLRIIYDIKTQRLENRRYNLLHEPDVHIIDRINDIPSYIKR